MLVCSQRVRDAMGSLVSGKDIVSVYNNERFCEVVFTRLDDERVYFTCSEVLNGTAVFSCPPYHFSSEFVREEQDHALYSIRIPDKVVVSQRRKFVRHICKSSIHVAFAGLQEDFYVVNLSMEGIDTESESEPFVIDQEIKGMTVTLEGNAIKADGKVRYMRRLPSGLVSTGFQFTWLNSHDARTLQKALSNEELWEPGDLAMST